MSESPDHPVDVHFASTRDGLTQLRRRWAVDEPRAAILMVHGIGEHSGRYLHVGAAFAAAGLDTLAADGRGYGQSGGRRAHVDSFAQYLDDVEDLLAERRELGVPVILLGHSLGGLIVSHYLVSKRPQPDLAVLSAPALEAVVPAWQRVGAPVLSRVAPRVFVPSPIDATLLSRREDVQQAYLDDPLRTGGATARLGAEIFEAMARTRAKLDRLRVPTYVLHGDDDRIVPTESSAVLEGRPGVTRRVWPGLRHEAFNEPEADQVLAEVVAWIDERLAALDPVS